MAFLLMRRKTKEKMVLEAESVGYMPERFIAGYFELVRLGLKTDPSAQVFDNESGTVKKKYHQHAGGIKDEAALRFKAWVDRQLRAIGRDVQAYLNARDSAGPSPIGLSSAVRREVARDLERKTELKCHNKDCKKYVSWQWAFCAWCGRAIHREDGNGSQVQDDRNGSDGGPSGSSSEPSAPIGIGVGSASGEDVDREDGDDTGHDDDGTDGVEAES